MLPVRSHVLVVDDDARLRQLLQTYLCQQGWYVTVAANTTEADELLGYFVFDALIVDVMMPGESGLDFVQRFRTHAATPVLMLSALGEADHRIAGLEGGADDYLAKPFEPRELLLRLQRLAKPTLERASVFGSFAFQRESRSLTHQGQPVYLTATETALLALLIEHEGQAMSREALFSALKMEGNERTLDVQITRLRKKIEANPKQPLFIRTLRGEGYAFFSQ
jgi:two-component system phosphate regulon response regulator OmpR